MRQIKARIAFTFLVALFALIAFAQSDRVFSVPLSDLQRWAEKIVVSMDVVVLGHSSVHAIGNNCEMHFGASATSYGGDPPGWVLEPMNLCLEPFPGKQKHSNRDWTSFGDSLKGKSVHVEGVPRIWPQHLVGSNDASNPDHALELHPLTKLRQDSKPYDFTTFVYAPEGFDGGVGSSTAYDILKNTTVSATETGGSVEINFASGRIGNFTTLQIRVIQTSIEEAAGGHRSDAEVIFAANDSVPVRIVMVDQQQIRAIRDTERVLNAVKDPVAAGALGRDFGCDIIVIGEAFSELAERSGNRVSCRARLEARAIKTDTGRIIVADGRHGSGIDLMEDIAGKTALKNAGSELADYFIERISKDIATQAASPNRIEATLMGVTFAEMQLVDGALKAIPGVSATEKTLSGTAARFFCNLQRFSRQFG